MFNGARTTKSTRTIFFLPKTLRQSLSCVLILFPCVLPGSRVEFCQWCALVRCSPFCSTFLFVPFAPKAPHVTLSSEGRPLLAVSGSSWVPARCVVASSLDSLWSLAIAGAQRTGAVCRACDEPSRPAATCPHGCPRLPRNRARRVAQSPTGERR